jgi:hypothetical protein
MSVLIDIITKGSNVSIPFQFQRLQFINLQCIDDIVYVSHVNRMIFCVAIDGSKVDWIRRLPRCHRH